ncbi:MAG TPA: M28 family peptidase [Solirubrobacteraceae bacterium]|nr:M28 family peptidase [Solirubrobacteraceae bacterium]
MTGTAEERLGRDVTALAGMVRDSAEAGERAAAEWAAARLRAAGVEDVALEPYRWPRTHAWSHLPHLAAAWTRRPLLAAAALVSYELDQSGRLQWVQRLVPKGEGINVVARIAPRRRAERTFVLVAHLDAQRSGLMWDRRIVEAGARRRLARRAMTPAASLAALAMALRSRVLLAVVAAFVLDTATRPTVPGANDNASGVAGALEVARRLAAEPLERTEVLVALPGAEEAGMGGMRAFLAAHPLDPRTTFVLGLDTIGSGVPVLAAAEGALLAHRYREQDLARVERAAGAAPPQRWRIAAYTDPILARFAGVPTASMLSVSPETGMYTRYHRMDDLPEHVDLACVARCADIAEAVARAGR